MKIDNFKVYDVAESVVASGLPMKTGYDAKNFNAEVTVVNCIVNDADSNPDVNMMRACRLANNPVGSGHCNFLSGILVAANVTATNVWWLQMERYHFVQIVSMQSKMHRLRQMLRDCTFTFPECIGLEAFTEAQQSLDSATDEQLAYICPMGLELTARITTNYLQLKTIYAQRKDHKLQEWRDFCKWIKSLPFAEAFITGAENNNQNN